MATEKKIPQRKCIGCGESKDKKELIRIIKSPEENIEFDPTGRKNGRGAYVCRTKQCLAKALKNRGLERSFKMKIPKDIQEELLKALEKEIDSIEE